MKKEIDEVLFLASHVINAAKEHREIIVSGKPDGPLEHHLRRQIEAMCVTVDRYRRAFDKRYPGRPYEWPSPRGVPIDFYDKAEVFADALVAGKDPWIATYGENK